MKKKFEEKWHFDRWAKTYDQSVKEEDWMYKDYNKILDKVLEYSGLPHNRNEDVVVLDIGIGTGNLAFRFLKEGLQVIGIEPSKEMRKICQEKYPNIQIYDGHFLNIPLEDKGIDLVVSSYTFHHLTSSEKEASISEMKRVLKPKGKIVIADLMFENAFNERQIKQKLIAAGRSDIVEEIADEYFGLFDELREVFLRNGFSFQGEQLTDFVWIFCALLK